MSRFSCENILPGLAQLFSPQRMVVFMAPLLCNSKPKCLKNHFKTLSHIPHGVGSRCKMSAIKVTNEWSHWGFKTSNNNIKEVISHQIFLSSRCTLREDFGKLESQFCDVNFVVGPSGSEEIIPAHVAIVAARSERLQEKLRVCFPQYMLKSQTVVHT